MQRKINTTYIHSTEHAQFLRLYFYMQKKTKQEVYSFQFSLGLKSCAYVCAYVDVCVARFIAFHCFAFCLSLCLRLCRKYEPGLTLQRNDLWETIFHKLSNYFESRATASHDMFTHRRKISCTEYYNGKTIIPANDSKKCKHSLKNSNS